MTKSALVRVLSLGQSIVEVGTTTIRPDSAVAFATATLLAAERGRPVARDSIVALLWPGEELNRGRHNLRQALYKLRLLGVDIGEAGPTLTLARKQVWLDYDDAPMNGAGMFSTESSVRFMPGTGPQFTPAFAQWLDDLRERAEGRTRHRLVNEIVTARREGRWHQVERLARLCLQIDPLNEEATLALAEALALDGAKTQAIALIDAYKKELGTDAPEMNVAASVLKRRIAERLPTLRTEGRIETRLFGREDILQVFTGAFESSRRGRTEAHVLYGISGIGKTRVAEELVRGAALKGARTFFAQAAPDDQYMPGMSLVRMVRMMINSPGALGLAPDVLVFLRQITSEAQDEPTSRPVDSSEDALVRATVDLLRALAWETAVLIVVDDIHCADELSQRVLDRAVGCLRTERIMVVAVGVTAPKRLMTSARIHELPRLSSAASGSYVRELCTQHNTSIDQQTEDLVVNACGGHVFMLREAVIAWLKNAAATFEASIDILLQRRVSGLPGDARDVLTSALLLGEHAKVSLLSVDTTLSAERFEHALVELEREQIIRVSVAGDIATHGLWLSSIDSLVPPALAAARRHRLASIMERAASDSNVGAELLVASALRFQRSGDVARASSAFARGAAALHERALAPGAFAAYTKAAQLAPQSAEYDRCTVESIGVARGARLFQESASMMALNAARLAQSTHIPDAAKIELAVIQLEIDRSGLRKDGVADRCIALLSEGRLTLHQRMRVLLAGIHAAEGEYDRDAVDALAAAAAKLQTDDAYALYVMTQIDLVHAIASGRLRDACGIAERAITRAVSDSSPGEQCHLLLNARMPFWLDCNHDQVATILTRARNAVGAYPCTYDALRIDDIYATHCVETLQLVEAKEVIARTERICQTYDYGAVGLHLRELRLRLAIANDCPTSTDLARQELRETSSHRGYSRLRTFALCDAAVALAGAQDREGLRAVVDELTIAWTMIKQACPFDYVVFALAIGISGIGARDAADELIATYIKDIRLAGFPPSPFSTALLRRFSLSPY